MSSYDLSHITDVGMEFSSGPSVSPFDMLEQSIQQQWHVDSQRALDEELRTQWAESLRALGAVGQRFNSPVDPNMYRDFARFVREGTAVTTPTIEGSGYGARINYDAQQPHPEFEEMRRANEAIRQLNNPDIRTFEQILEEVSEMQRDVEEQTASMSERAGWSGFIFGELPGAIIGSFTPRDPLNVVTAPIGAGRTIAARIATDMLVAAGVVTATEFGDVAPNRALAGLPERNPLFNIAAATLGAGVIRGALIEPAGYALRRLRERPVIEDIDFDLRDSQLRQMFTDNADRPSARAAASVLDDTIFIERNNPYGEGRAASERFIAELRGVQRAMNGEPMTAVARVLPPMPFEYIQKAADFEIVREQAPLLYARMEQAQAHLSSLPRQTDEVFEQPEIIDGNTLNSLFADKNGRVDMTAAGAELSDRVTQAINRGLEVTLIVGEKSRRIVDTRAHGLVDEQGRLWGILSIFRAENDRVEIKRPQAVSPEIALRRAANKEYQTAYRAVEAEAVRLREQQARVDAIEQGKAADIFAVGLEGRPFIGPALQHDYVKELVERINAFNDTLDEKAVAAFAREVGELIPSEGKTIVYHGTRAKFDRFRTGYEGEGVSGEAREGFFFTTNLEEAKSYVGGTEPGARVIAAELDLKNPLTLRYAEHKIDNIIKADSEVAAYIRQAKEGGSDGLVLEGIANDPDKSLYVAFSEEQINIIDPEYGSAVNWRTADGGIDIGLREPVDPEFRITTDDGDISIADAMRDLQDDADLDEAMRTCLR